MTKRRPGRVREALRQEISKILQEEVKDPRIGFITVTRVELTDDLRFARIYFSVLGEKKEQYKALKGLNSAKGYIRNQIADRVKLRLVPDIRFMVDDTLGRAQAIYDLLDKIKKDKKHDEASG